MPLTATSLPTDTLPCRHCPAASTGACTHMDVPDGFVANLASPSAPGQQRIFCWHAPRKKQCPAVRGWPLPSAPSACRGVCRNKGHGTFVLRRGFPASWGLWQGDAEGC